MRKLLVLFIAISAIGLFAKSRKANIMQLPPFERAVLIIKHYETLHNGVSTWPYVGYGHMKLPGEKYYKGYRMTECEADDLLRRDLKKFIALFADFPPTEALLLGVLSYNIGPGAVQKSEVYKRLKRGDHNIARAYTSLCHYRGRFHRLLHQRRCAELLALFPK